MDVYQCPCCDLRFQFASELLQHVSVEHPQFEVHPKTVEDALLSASHRHRHGRHHHPPPDRNATR